MPSPQEILADPNFHALPLGERLKVMRTVDPNFAALAPKDQGTVLYQSAASLHPSTDSSVSQPEDQGFLSTLGKDLVALPGGVISAVRHPLDTLANATQSRLALRPKATQALKEGNYSGAAGYGLASMMPFVGPMAAQAGEELGGGQPGQGAAHAAEVLAPFAARIPEVRAKVLPSEETVGTLKEYIKPKGWREANARYQAKKNPTGPAPSIPAPSPPYPAASAPAPIAVAPNGPPQGVPQELWERLSPDNQQQLRQKIEGGQTQAAPTPGLTAPRMSAPSPLPSPTIPTAAPAAPATTARPLGGTPIAENEANLVNTLRGNTTRKNLEIGQYFTGKGMTPEQVAAMPESQFNAHIRNVKNASGNSYQPSTGRNYHRTPEQARADVVNAMRAMQPLPAPTMPTMIAAPPAPRGFFPPPTWPPQPPAQ